MQLKLPATALNSKPSSHGGKNISIDNILDHHSLSQAIGKLAKSSATHERSVSHSKHLTRSTRRNARYRHYVYKAIDDDKNYLAIVIVNLIIHELKKEDPSSLNLAKLSEDKHSLVQKLLEDHMRNDTILAMSTLTLAAVIVAMVTLTLLMHATVINTPALAAKLISSDLLVYAVSSVALTSATSLTLEGIVRLYRTYNISKGADLTELNFDIHGLGHI